MAPRPAPPALETHLSAVVVVIILLACSATGLLAGAIAHSLASGFAHGDIPAGPVISGTPPAQAAATATPTLIATDTPATGGNVTGFTLSIAVSPRSASAGDSLTVTVRATANGAAVEGLTCSLRAPTSGPPGLLSAWPDPVSTDANGDAVWTLTVPSVAPGTYGIEVSAVGTHRYSFHRYATVSIS